MKELAPGRIMVVDALRGFCLFGILLAHFAEAHAGGPTPGADFNAFALVDKIAVILVTVLVVGKFFALFSFLFGLSFWLQMQGGSSSSQSFLPRYLRRLFILLLIALVHQTFWMGDILIIYVPLAFVLLAFRRMPGRWLLIAGLCLVMNVPGRLYDVLNFLLLHQQQPDMMGSIAKPYEDIILHGSLPDLWAFNWSTFPNKMHMQVFSGRLAQTLGFFLLGLYAGRQGWLTQAANYRPQLKAIRRRTGWILLTCLLLAVGLLATNELAKMGWEQSPVMGFVFTLLIDAFNSSMVGWYVCVVALLLTGQSWWQPRLAALSPVGKMALTAYLLQTVVGLALFFGFGAGLYQQTGSAVNMLLAFGFFILQVWLARWWFQHYRFGPVEWLWRSGTAGRWQPWHIAQAKDA